MLVSGRPNCGRAVSQEKGEPYHDKLLRLPDFLRPGGSDIGLEEVFHGLVMTGHFLEHWVFAQSTKGVPEPRLRFQERLGNAMEHGT